MVWMELAKPITKGSGGADGEPITHWPAIVTDRTYLNRASSVVDYAPAVGGSKPQPRFSYELSWAYGVSPLACSNALKIKESQLMPFVGRPLPQLIVKADSKAGMEHVLRNDRERRADLESLHTVDDARIAFGLAVQTAIFINVGFSLLSVVLRYHFTLC